MFESLKRKGLSLLRGDQKKTSNEILRNMKINFLTGFPRSGTTLLAALLRQNPKFYSSISSPLSDLFYANELAMAQNKETGLFIKDELRDKILKNLFNSYYEDFPEVVFDNSRLWSARLPILSKLFQEAKFIVCVRELGWVVDSFERLYRKNGMAPNAIYSWSNSGTVFERAKTVTASEGVVGFALNAVQEAVASEEASKILLLDYENICKYPEGVMKKLYEFVNEPYFEHDFENFNYSENEFDLRLGARGLHNVSGPIVWQPRNTILPLSLFHDINKNNFWRKNNAS
jgi:sulfotransferase